VQVLGTPLPNFLGTPEKNNLILKLRQIKTEVLHIFNWQDTEDAELAILLCWKNSALPLEEREVHHIEELLFKVIIFTKLA